MRLPATSPTRLSLRACVLLCGAVALTAPAAAQVMQGPPPPALRPAHVRMQSILDDAQELATRPGMTRAAVQRELKGRAIDMRDDGRVHVEIVGPPGGKPVEDALVVKVGGEVTVTWFNRMDAWVPVESLRDLAASLPEDQFMSRAAVPSLDSGGIPGEGPQVTNSLSYKVAGADGHGVTIAIIDTGYAGLTDARNHGEAPSLAQTTQINLTGSPAFELPTDITHGTGCVETAYDHCPGATWRLYKVNSLTTMGAAAANAVANGANVISHSISWYNTGWVDDTGPACQAVTNAGNNGVLFCTSAGNRALNHWEGNFADPDANGWHNWGPGPDETINLSVAAHTQLNLRMQWNTAGGVYNYDMYVYDSTMTTVLASSINIGNTYEELTWINPSSTAQVVHFMVWRASGGITPFEVFTFETTWLEHIVSLGSTTSPSNTTHPLAISCGAISWPFYSLPAGSDPISNFSGRGPSNSGMLLPDVAGPTNTHGYTYKFGFDQTSCATANVAGAVTAFLSGNATLSPTVARYLIGRQAGIFRDWGAPGPDLAYGSGGLYLHNYVPGTAWIDRSFGPPVGTPLAWFYQPPFHPTSAVGGETPPSPPVTSQPFYYVSDAQNWAPTNGRLLFLGQSYPEPVVLNKKLRIESIGSTAHIGQ